MFEKIIKKLKPDSGKTKTSEEVDTLKESEKTKQVDAKE
jgi:hypothetical protein